MDHHPLQGQLRNSLTSEREARDRGRILSAFPVLRPDARARCLVLRRYLDERPDKFFDEDSYSVYLSWLQGRDATDRRSLTKYFDQFAKEIDSALLFLQEVNSKTWHDDPFAVGDDEFNLIRSIDAYVHPSYLRVVEAVFAPLVRPIAYFHRISRGKGTAGLDVWNVVQEISSNKGNAEHCLVLPYKHTVRNGIGHGGITFRKGEIRYRDKRGHEEMYHAEDIVRTFDDLLDTCNGVALALKVFFVTKGDRGYKRPRQLLVEELQEETRTPWWTIDGCLEAEGPGKGNQLIVYARPSSIHAGMVHLSTVQSGILAELFAPGYDRYFLSLRSQLAWPGWAAFDGRKLRQLREAGVADMRQYRGIIENDMIFYVPWVSIPTVFGKVVVAFTILRILVPLTAQQIREKLGTPSVVCRSAIIHRNSWGAVLNADVVMQGLEGKAAVDAVIKYRRYIVRSARRHARRLNRLSGAAYLPLAFVQVQIYRRDYRKRRLRSLGLGRDLICTLRLQRMRRIKSPDIIGSTVQVVGQWRIAWNRAWLQSWRGEAERIPEKQ